MKCCAMVLALMVTACATAPQSATAQEELEATLRSTLRGSVAAAVLHFYATANQWSPVHSRAFAVTENAAYFLEVTYKARRLPVRQTRAVRLKSCSALNDAVVTMKTRLDRYNQDPTLARSETEMFLDGPTYDLRQYDAHGNMRQEWSDADLLMLGQTVSLGEAVLAQGWKC